MWPSDLKVMWSRVKNLSTAHGFPPNTRPFFVQEVLGACCDYSDQYLDTGIQTESQMCFKFTKELDNNRMHTFKGVFVMDINLTN